MNVLITGGTGFLGRRLLAALLERGSLPDASGNECSLSRIRISDVVAPSPGLPEDPRVEVVQSDIGAPSAALDLLGDDTDVVFHLAAVVSGQAEADFELGMRVNLDGTRWLLDACRAMPRAPRLLFASSVAAFGGDMPEVLDDRTHLTPQSSYGTQKAIGELLLNDYSRKGYVDARALRLPTVIVRPGRPNAAASSFASAIVREPLEGREYACPVAPQTRMWVMSPRRVTASLMHAATLDASALGSFRALSLPGITVSVADTVAALERIAGADVVARLRFEPDAFIESIVGGWATDFDPRRALSLGFSADPGVEQIIQAFIEDDLSTVAASQ